MSTELLLYLYNDSQVVFLQLRLSVLNFHRSIFDTRNPGLAPKSQCPEILSFSWEIGLVCSWVDNPGMRNALGTGTEE